MGGGLMDTAWNNVYAFKPRTGTIYYDVIDVRDWLFRDLVVTEIPTFINVSEANSITIGIQYSMDKVLWSDVITPLTVGTIRLSRAYNYLRPVITLTISDPEPALLPQVTGSLIITGNSVGTKASWTSPVIDVSKSIDISSGMVKLSVDETKGNAIMFSRSGDTNTVDGTWTDWARVFADGSLTHIPADFIQLLVVLVGSEVILNSIDISFDGESLAIPFVWSLAPNTPLYSTTLSDKLVLSNGVDPMLTWDGSTADPTLLAEGIPSLTSLITHQNRVWGVDKSYTSMLRFSDILDPTVWGGFSYMDCNPADGDYITALIRFGQNLIVAKQRSMAIVTGDRLSNYAITWLDSESGVVGSNAICVTDKYICYVASDGVRFYDLNTSTVATLRMIPDWENLNHKVLKKAAITYWKNCLYVALPSKDSLVNDQVWCYDFLHDSWAIYKGWKVSCWLHFNQFGEECLLAGDAEVGQVYDVFKGTMDEGEYVGYEWQSKDFDFNYPEKLKLFRNVFIDLTNNTTDSLLEVDLIVDGAFKGKYTTTILGSDTPTRSTRRVLPPLYNAVLGSYISLRIRTKCGIESITIDYVIRGNVVGGDI